MNLENRGRRSIPLAALFLVVVTVAALLPFIDKAFHIDDPVYIWVAQHLRQSPLDFFGFDINWHNRSEPVYEVNKNPPGVSYYIAAAWLVGWSEPALHTAFLVPAVAAALGIYVLARRWTRYPLLAAFIAILTPVFIVSSTNVMADTLALACYMWTITLWVRGTSGDDWRSFLAASLILAAGVLVKYPVLTALPLLIAYTLFVKFTPRDEDAQTRSPIPLRPFLFLLVPIALVAAYDIYTTRIYGAGMITEAVSFSSGAASTLSRYRIAASLSFVGGCFLPVAFFMPFLWKPPALMLWGLAFLTVSALLFSMTGVGVDPRIIDGERYRWEFLAQYGLFITAGIHLITLTIREVLSRRDAVAVTLACWVLGVSVFAMFVNWTVNARTLLPMAPAVGILVARRLESTSYNPRFYALPLGFAAILSLTVATADYTFAATNRRMAVETAARITTADPVWFQGRWGQRYYWEALGYRSLDMGDALGKPRSYGDDLNLADLGIQPGDWIVEADRHRTIILPRNELKRVDTFSVPGPQWVATMDRDTGAGFYQYNWGPLPYAFGPAAPETVTVYRVVSPPGE